jgi:outer membrane protein assembly factor BamB
MRSYVSRLTALTLAVTLALLAATPGAARGEENWPHWRGPKFNGSSDAKNLPEKFGKGENLLWSTALPGPSNGTPIVWGDRVFVTAVDVNSRKLLAICVGRQDGKILWQKDVGIGFVAKGENNMATPSPVTDGKTVWFLFGTGDLAAFDFEGKQLWSRNLQKDYGPFNIMWIYGSSPTLYKGKLYVQVLHTNRSYGDTALQGAAKVEGDAKSYLLALDPASGKELWRHFRDDDARGETKEAYTTPIPHTTAAGKDEILLVGGDAVTAHDPESGAELWRYGGWNPGKIGHWRMVPSVVAGGGVVVACAPKGGPVMAMNEENGKQAWLDDKITSDVSVPLFYKGSFYVLDPNGKKVHRVEPKDGGVKWTAELGGGAIFRASPTGADDKIYCINVTGDVWVLSPEDGKVLHKTNLAGEVPAQEAGGPRGARRGREAGARGTIAAADGALFVRMPDTLYCFGKKN